MNGLRPFWTFFGGKWRLAPLYPKPQHITLVEPFAGAAGYSLRYHAHNVVLVEKDPLIAGIWRWLLGVSSGEVMRLPLLPESGYIDYAKWPCEEARVAGLCGRQIPKGCSPAGFTYRWKDKIQAEEI